MGYFISRRTSHEWIFSNSWSKRINSLKRIHTTKKMSDKSVLWFRKSSALKFDRKYIGKMGNIIIGQKIQTNVPNALPPMVAQWKRWEPPSNKHFYFSLPPDIGVLLNQFMKILVVIIISRSIGTFNQNNNQS